MRVAIIGAAGRMGQALIGAIANDPAARLSGALEREGADAILRDAGMSLENIVRINAFVTGREHLAPYMKVRDELFGDPAPASTLVIVSGFARPEFTVEIEAIAAARAGDNP